MTKPQTTLEKLKELQGFYIEDTHFPEEAARLKWEILLRILIEEYSPKPVVIPAGMNPEPGSVTYVKN